MSTLLQQINESADEHAALVENTILNVRTMFNGFADDKLAVIAESAAKYLGRVAAELKFKRQLSDLPKAVDMLTALRVIGSAENRDAFNINLKTFKVLVQKAGEDANADAALMKLAQNPSVASVRQQIEAMLNDAMQKGDNELGVALSNVNKLRLGYERVQGKLQAAGDSSSAVSQNPNGASAPQGKPTSAWTNAGPGTAPQNSTTNNHSATAA